LYVFRDDKTEEKITLGSVERRKEFRILVEEFKTIINQLSFDRINAEDVKICGIKQEFFKVKYLIDTNGCIRVTYKEVLALLNNMKIQVSSLPNSAISSGAPISSKSTLVKKTASGSVSTKTSTTVSGT
jgi:hypothetical protein